jgi:two-component system, response regulator YesN
MDNQANMKRILIVDDEANIAMVLAACASRLGPCVVDMAYSGQQALSAFQREPYDLVITDYRMPDISGLELAEAMRGLAPRVPIVLMTAYDTIALRQEAALLPVDEYLEKPISITKIQEIVSRILANGRLSD